jgi:outer membrane receptor protein involved in Fe transport
MGPVDVEPPESANTFPNFRHIGGRTYIDLYASYTFADKYTLSFGAMNVTDKDPPVVGNEAAATDFNSGNTFPASYEVLGRQYTLQLNMLF